MRGPSAPDIVRIAYFVSFVKCFLSNNEMHPFWHKPPGMRVYEIPFRHITGYNIRYPDLSKSNQFVPQVERGVRLPDGAQHRKYASESRRKMERFWQIVGPCKMDGHRGLLSTCAQRRGSAEVFEPDPNNEMHPFWQNKQ